MISNSRGKNRLLYLQKQSSSNTGWDVCFEELASIFMGGLPTCIMPRHHYLWIYSCQLLDCVWDDGLEQSTCQVQTTHKGVYFLYSGQSLSMFKTLITPEWLQLERTTSPLSLTLTTTAWSSQIQVSGSQPCSF